MNLETFCVPFFRSCAAFSIISPTIITPRPEENFPVMNCFRFSLLQKRNSCLFLLICQLSYLQKIRKLYIPISRNFRKFWKTPAVFFQQSDSPSQILEIFGSIMNTNITTNFALESHPCLALMSYGPDFVQALFENRDIDHSNSVYTQLVSILKQPQFAFTENDTSCNYFTLNGIRKFAQTGLLDGPYSLSSDTTSKRRTEKIDPAHS